MYREVHMEIKVPRSTCAFIILFFIIFLVLKKTAPIPILTFAYAANDKQDLFLVSYVCLHKLYFHDVCH